jgi:hypothetical protein
LSGSAKAAPTNLPADERPAFTKLLAHGSALLKKSLPEAAKPGGWAADTSVWATQHERVNYRVRKGLRLRSILLLIVKGDQSSHPQRASSDTPTRVFERNC